MKRHKFKNSFAKKNIILVAVTLILVTMTVIGTSLSWIEDVSKVEFNNNSGQETPHHITDKILKADIVSKKPSLDAQTGVEQINTVSLDQYFNASGDMHLSPCYGDGEKFYFPVEGGAVGEYREGNKDDVNVNYLSTTFRIKSEDADTVYWFEKSGANNDTSYVSFRKGDGNTNTSLSEYLRCSITVDGATQVYTLNSDGAYRVSASGSAQNGRRIDKYTYFQEKFNSDGTPDTTANNAAVNMGASGTDLNGNILFTVPKYVNSNSIKTVTVKLWLEAGSYTAGTGVDIADLNLNIVSSWAKKRRIYVQDNTVDEINSSGTALGEHWLTNSGSLHWGVNINGTLTEIPGAADKGNVGNLSTTHKKYFDIPAVYNGTNTALYRCNGSWNTGVSHTGDIRYNNKYVTVFPNTFHSETYTVYTAIFGTWDSVARHVEVVNSCKYDNSPYLGDNQFGQIYSYMWDSSTDISGQRVVQNSNWPGVSMTKLNTTSGGFNIFAFYYDSIYDRIIFNDNYDPSSAAYQTQDINLDQAKTNPQYYDGKVYDMATLKWYNSRSALPTYSGYSVLCNVYNSDDANRFTVTRMVNGTNNEVYCRVYVRYPSTGTDFYSIKVMKNDKTEYWGYGQDNTDHVYWLVDGQMSGSNKPTLSKDTTEAHYNDVRLKATNTSYYTDAQNINHPGIYGIYYNTSDHTLWIQKEQPNGTHIS